MTDFITAVAAMWPTAVAVLGLGFLAGFSAFVVFSEQASRKAATEARAVFSAEALALAKDGKHREQAERAQAIRKALPSNQRGVEPWWRTTETDWLDDEWDAIRKATDLDDAS